MGKWGGYWMPGCKFVSLWKPETCGRAKGINTTQEWCSFRRLCSGCFGTWSCSCLSAGPFMCLRCSRKKMMFRLLCNVFFSLAPEPLWKPVVKLAVACAKALHLETSANMYVEMCTCVYSCFVLYSTISKVLLAWSPKSRSYVVKTPGWQIGLYLLLFKNHQLGCSKVSWFHSAVVTRTCTWYICRRKGRDKRALSWWIAQVRHSLSLTVCFGHSGL